MLTLNILDALGEPIDGEFSLELLGGGQVLATGVARAGRITFDIDPSAHQALHIRAPRSDPSTENPPQPR